MSVSYENNQKDRVPYGFYRTQFAAANPLEIVDRTGIPYDPGSGKFKLTLLNREYLIHYPDYEIEQTEPDGYHVLTDGFAAKILIIRYLLGGRRVEARGDFYTYRDMPWGEVYNQQFTGRCIKRLAFSFGNNLESFCAAMERMGGTHLSLGDASYEFNFLNNLVLRFILWEGDEEFPPSAQILFSDNFPFAFTAEDMAVVGDVVLNTLKALSK